MEFIKLRRYDGMGSGRRGRPGVSLKDPSRSDAMLKNKRMSKNDPDYGKRALVVADLTAKGFEQNPIAERLGVSQPQVSRLLRHAEKEGWIIKRPYLDQSKIPKDLYEAMRREFQDYEGLNNTVRRWAPPGVRCEVRVAEATDDVFNGIAANWIAELVTKSRLIGVMYGRTVAQLVTGIGKHFEGAPPVDDVQCIPLCPEPHYLLNEKPFADYSSTMLAANLHLHLTGKRQKDMPTLQGVPAYLRSTLTPEEQQVIRDYIDDLPGHRRIFGPSAALRAQTNGKAAGKGRGKPAAKARGKAGGAPGLANDLPLVQRIDTLITGVGVVKVDDESRMGTFVLERLKQETHVTAADLNEWIFGDIGGLLLRRPKITARGRKIVDAMNKGWLGSCFSDYRSAAERATESKRPGNIVVAIGADKSEMICAAIQCGLVNTLIINHELAAGLESLPNNGVLPEDQRWQ
jgi:DNA-binding transcriptional regulator LsrR (DeoR family)